MPGTIEIERRSFAVREIRAEDEEGGPVISGYAAVFNQPSEDLGGFVEYIEPGAFAASLGRDDIRALWNHNADFPLGRVRAGTLRLDEDEIGLAFRINLPDTQYARDLVVSMKRGDVDQMSFGFRTVRDRWAQNENGLVMRTLIEAELFDVSPVTFPAYSQTSAVVRSALEAFTTNIQADVAGKSIVQARNAHRQRKLQILKLK